MSLSPHELALKAGLAVSRRFAGVSVTYTRGATTVTVNKAIQADIEYATLSQDGSESVVEVIPWLIDVASLVGLFPPQQGDTIVRTIDDTDHTYTVENLSIGQSHWDYSDTGRTQVRIRTRLDGAAAYEITKPSGFDLSGNEMRYA